MINKLVCYLFLVISVFLHSSCKNNTYSQGKRLYQAHCANCHMDDGKGLAKLIPPLANSDYLRSNQNLIPCIILKGQSGVITVNGVMYDQEMPGAKYTDIQINNMINYINTAWENEISPVSLMETRELLEGCEEE